MALRTSWMSTLLTMSNELSCAMIPFLECLPVAVDPAVNGQVQLYQFPTS